MVNTSLVMDLFRARKLKYHKIYNLEQSQHIARVPDILYSEIKEEVEDQELPLYSDDENVFDQYLRDYVQRYFATEGYIGQQVNAWDQWHSDEEALDLSSSLISDGYSPSSSMSDGYSPSSSPVSSISSDFTVPETYLQSFTADSLKSRDGRSKAKANVKQTYKCQECGKTFATSSNISRHKQTHRVLSPENAKSCHICHKLYVSMPALQMHILTHKLSHA